jgi:iron complex transport system substrate-binding protein
MRIVSLLPSTTEILFGIGAGDDVVGVTFECDTPPEARERTIVSTSAMPEGLSASGIDAFVADAMRRGVDLYHLDEGALAGLDADLVVTQDLCAVCAIDVADVDAALEHLGCRADVLTLDPQRLEDVLASISEVGVRVGRGDAADALVASLRSRLDAVALAVAGAVGPRMAVLEWPDPPYSSGHWVPDLVVAAGATPVLGRPGDRSRAVTWADVAASEPGVVVVAPCGYGLDTAAALALELTASLPAGAEVWAADADAAFVRPGPRLVDGVEALASIAHPALVPARPDVVRRVA